MYSLLGGLVSGSSEESDWLILLFFLWVENPFSSFIPFSNSTIVNPVLSPIVGCEHLSLCLSEPGRAYQETVVSVYKQSKETLIVNWRFPMG